MTNTSSMATTTFMVTLDTNASTVYTTWNGNFSGQIGAVTVTPGFSWNSSIEPGETDVSIGFCANRTVSGSSQLAISA